MPVNSISNSKLHCFLVILILFIVVFLSVPLFLFRLANDNHDKNWSANCSQSTSGNETNNDGRPVQCLEGFFPCASCQGICIPQSKQCDGDYDCPDRSDEARCHDSNGALGNIFRRIYEIRNQHPGGAMLAIPESCDEERFFNDQCPCNMSEPRVIICDGVGLKQVPANEMLASVFKIRMNNNSIEELEGAQWPKALGVLALTHNNLTRITRRAFESAKNLSKLYLSHNNISHIDEDAFDHLDSLSTIQIESNRLRTFSTRMLLNKPAMTTIHLSENQIDLPRETRFSMGPNVKEIHLDHNQISVIRRHYFSNMTRLIWLSLTNNRITSIEPSSFEGDYDLQELNLSFNLIQIVDRRIFAHRLNIQRLFLSSNPIETLPVDAFREVLELKSLNLTQIEFKSLDSDTFGYLRHLDFIYFERFGYCYYAAKVRVCRPTTDGLSTFEEMLAFPVLKYAVWIVALVCCFGNLFVLIWRLVSRDEDKTLSLLVKNLSVADLMMGIYLCTIAWQDHKFQHKFRENAAEWMSSWKCPAIGFLALISSELSVFILAIITWERHRAIVSLRRFQEFEVRQRARRFILWAWLFAFSIAAYPILEWLRQAPGAYYATNGLCLPLYIDQPFTRGWQYSAFVYLGINFSAVLLIISLYARMYMIIIDSHQCTNPALLGGERNQDAILAIRFFFIVVTDCLCWIPIVVIKVIALMDLKFSPSIYGWLVVFIIPINSALNPIVYTLAAPSLLRSDACRLLRRTCHLVDLVWCRLDRLVWHGLRCRVGGAHSTGGGPMGCGGRSARARGSNYSSSHSTSSASAASDMQLIHGSGQRTRHRLNTGSNSTTVDTFESSLLAAASRGSKLSFESAVAAAAAAAAAAANQHQHQHQHQQNLFLNQQQQLNTSSLAGEAQLEKQQACDLLDIRNSLTGTQQTNQLLQLKSQAQAQPKTASTSSSNSTSNEEPNSLSTSSSPSVALDSSQASAMAAGERDEEQQEQEQERGLPLLAPNRSRRNEEDNPTSDNLLRSAALARRQNKVSFSSRGSLS